jgi:Recombination endonuclease VII
MICPDCGLEKPPGDFPRSRGRKSGRGTYCKTCHNARGRASRRLHEGNRHYHLRQRYGIGARDVNELIERQGALCAICRTRSATQVDHYHKTGKVRGALCLECNAAIGAFKDSVRLIYNAVDYLDPTPIETLAT